MTNRQQTASDSYSFAPALPSSFDEPQTMTSTTYNPRTSTFAPARSHLQRTSRVVGDMTGRDQDIPTSGMPFNPMRDSNRVRTARPVPRSALVNPVRPPNDSLTNAPENTVRGPAQRAQNRRTAGLDGTANDFRPPPRVLTGNRNRRLGAAPPPPNFGPANADPASTGEGGLFGGNRNDGNWGNYNANGAATFGHNPPMGGGLFGSSQMMNAGMFNNLRMHK